MSKTQRDPCHVSGTVKYKCGRRENLPTTVKTNLRKSINTNLWVLVFTALFPTKLSTICHRRHRLSLDSLRARYNMATYLDTHMNTHEHTFTIPIMHIM